MRLPFFLTSSLPFNTGRGPPAYSHQPERDFRLFLAPSKHREGTGAYPLEQRIRRSRAFFESLEEMAENNAPKGVSAKEAVAGVPFYERQRQHLKELISKRRLLEKRIVSASDISSFYPLAPGGVFGKGLSHSSQDSAFRDWRHRTNHGRHEQAAHDESIYTKETDYLESTPNGNIITGFDNYTKGTGGAAGRRKTGLNEANRVFSRSSVSYNNSNNNNNNNNVCYSRPPSGDHMRRGIPAQWRNFLEN